jgi:hypothetical protein
MPGSGPSTFVAGLSSRTRRSSTLERQASRNILVTQPQTLVAVLPRSFPACTERSRNCTTPSMSWRVTVAMGFVPMASRTHFVNRPRSCRVEVSPLAMRASSQRSNHSLTVSRASVRERR